MAEEEYEAVLCVKPAVLVYRLPPRASNRGYRAAEWQLEQPSWSGRMRITAKGKVAFIRLEDKTSGELFAQAPVEQFPGVAVESVTDSSRYFVIRIEDGNGTAPVEAEVWGEMLGNPLYSPSKSSLAVKKVSKGSVNILGRRAFIGVGFVDRGDAFDFNVALQDHFKWVRQQSELAGQAQGPSEGPTLDLGFKEGQTIKLNIANVKKKEGAAGSARPRPVALGRLPPPPGRASVPAPRCRERPCAPAAGGPSAGSPGAAPLAAAADVWGDFAAAAGSTSNTNQENAGWVRF